ncbi:hypothetical protein EIP86_000817 [Pleurotus ostreatoroseus]|nr:hypothetical protein EIP86_000817 [Pleurotus ostreatoroseus]
MDPIVDMIAYITRLDLDDIESLQERSRHKGQGGTTLSDEELAMLLFVEEAEGLLNIVKGHGASSVRQPATLLQELVEREEMERYDHEVALAIHEGRPIPSPPERRSIATSDNFLTREVPVLHAPTITVDDAIFSSLEPPQETKHLVREDGGQFSPEPPERRSIVITGDSTFSARDAPYEFEDDLDASDTSSTIFSDDRSMYASSSRTDLNEIDEAGPSSSLHPNHKVETSYCTICCDDISGAIITAPCGHAYDVGCMEVMFSKASTDETLYPPRCCLMPIPSASVEGHISPHIMAQFQTRSLEFDTPHAKRLYCSQPRCSAFLGETTELPTDLRCASLECSTRTCGKCGLEAHAEESCPDKRELEEKALGQMATELNKENGWQRCYSCHHMVEKSDGCYHMTCICKAEFCYLCATKWKTCDCPHFEIPPELIRL